MTACVTCGSACPPVGWESCRACVRAGRAEEPVCPLCGERGIVRYGACSTCRTKAHDATVKPSRPGASKPSGRSPRKPKPGPGRSPDPMRRPMSPAPQRRRRPVRPYSRKDFVAHDGTLIPRGDRGSKYAALERMRARDADRAAAVRHLVHRASRPTGAPAATPSGMSKREMSYDWWRYD